MVNTQRIKFFLKPQPKTIRLNRSKLSKKRLTIDLPELKVKFLLDTGNSRSSIRIKFAYKYFQNFISNQKCNIQISHNVSLYDELPTIPEFNVKIPIDSIFLTLIKITKDL